MSTSKVSSRSVLYQTIRDIRQYEIPDNTRYQCTRDTRKYEILASTIYYYAVRHIKKKDLPGSARYNEVQDTRTYEISGSTSDQTVQYTIYQETLYFRQDNIPGSTDYQAVRYASKDKIRRQSPRRIHQDASIIAMIL